MADKKLSAYDVLSQMSGEDLIVALKSLGEGKYQNANVKFSQLVESCGVPPGSIILFAGEVEHLEGYIWCNGQAVSRSKFSKLFVAIKETYGKGDGANTFNVPDFRGCFLRGCGGNSNAVGQIQYDAIRNITGNASVITNNVYGDNVLREDKNGEAIFATIERSEFERLGRPVPPAIPFAALNFDAARVVPTTNENRPLNFAVHYFIKY